MQWSPPLLQAARSDGRARSEGSALSRDRAAGGWGPRVPLRPGSPTTGRHRPPSRVEAARGDCPHQGQLRTGLRRDPWGYAEIDVLRLAASLCYYSAGLGNLVLICRRNPTVHSAAVPGSQRSSSSAGGGSQLRSPRALSCRGPGCSGALWLHRR